MKTTNKTRVVSKTKASEREVLHFVSAPIGDWFHITTESEFQGAKCIVTKAWIERVVVWHHKQTGTTDPYIQGIGSNGLALVDEENGWEGAYVRGDDRAPNGKLWHDVYHASKSQIPGIYHIEDLSVFDSTRPLRLKKS